MIDALPLLLGPEGYQISRSVRLRESASGYLQRTNGTTGTDPLKFTVSGWMKRGASTTYFPLLGSATGSAAFDFVGFSADNIGFRIRNSSGTDVVQVISSAVYRDFSAWYHIVAVYDSANATSTERVKLYVNGVQITAFGTATYPSLNQGFTGDFLTDMQIGRTNTNSSNQNYGDGYITEVNFIDGQALTPSSFGETDAVTGVWKPKKYTGTYGTNGFYLNFSDNSAATAAAIGKDSSGNGNDWTPNNISVTAGVTYDSMLDVPTQWADGDNGRGNYCTLNPLSYDSGTYTLSNANLTYAGSRTASATAYARSTISVSSGKWYWEAVATNVGVGPNLIIGVQDASTSATTGLTNTVLNGYGYNGAALKYDNAGSASYGATWTNGDVIGIAFDLDAGTITFYKNNVSQGIAYSSISGTYCPVIVMTTAGIARTIAGSINFGQRPFSYTPPTGFKALNTLNLPTPTILNGNQYFDATLWTGTGATLSVTNSGSMQPDLVWIKQRSAVRSNRLHDSVRGVNKQLFSDTTGAETSNTDELTAFNSNGFTLSTSAGVNASAGTYVGWQWKEGPTQGFDIVTYTGNGANRTVSHSLGVAPKMIIIKNRSTSATSWYVYQETVGAAAFLVLNTTAASTASTTAWNNTAPSSTVFSLGVSATNFSSDNYVAYLFSEVAGFSKFGSWTGNASADGPFVFCGFRPRFVLFKRTDSATGGEWAIYDSSRDRYNANTTELYPSNSSADETAGGASMDFTSNGFKIRNSRLGINASGGTYIFAAFAEHPFKNALAR
jgi:hypothetical protein